MANPNILAASSITGHTTYLIPSDTNPNVLLTNASASGTILKVNSLMVANVHTSAVLVTVSVNSAGAGGGTAYRIAYQISVPVGVSLPVIDKSTALYLGENQSIVVTSSVASKLEYVASYEIIT